MQIKYTRKDFNAAHQVCFANLRTLRGKPRGVLTRVISAKIKKECRLHSSLVLVEKWQSKKNLLMNCKPTFARKYAENVALLSFIRYGKIN